MCYFACPCCDLLIKSKSIVIDQRAYCPRCDQLVYHDKKELSDSLAMLIVAIIVYFPAILLPFLNIQTIGKGQEISLLSSIFTIASGNNIYLAITVFILIILIPLIKLLGMLLIILPLSVKHKPLLSSSVIHIILNITSYSMIEIYLISTIVTLVKLTDIAYITFLSGFYAFALLIIIDALISITLPKKRIWQNIKDLNYNNRKIRNEK